MSVDKKLTIGIIKQTNQELFFRGDCIEKKDIACNMETISNDVLLDDSADYTDGYDE